MEEKSSLILVFGDTPLIRILDFFLAEGKYFDYSMTEIAKNAEVSWSTLHQIFPKFVKLGIVKETRQIARAKLYKLDTENPLVKELLEIDFKISKIFVEQELNKQKIKLKH